MEQTTAPLLLVKEIEHKELKNAKGEPYILHKVLAKSKKAEFEAIMFLPPDSKLEFGQEKQFSITKGQRGGWVIKELRDKKPWTGAKTNVPLEIQRIALAAASAIAPQGDVAGMLKMADQIAEHIRQRV